MHFSATHLTFFLATATLASGCVSYRPEALEPASELALLAGRTPADVAVVRFVDHPSLRGTLAEVSPFDPLDGLSEAEVVAVALALNADLRAKRAELGEAQALLVAAGQWPNAEVGVGWKPGIGGASGYIVEADALFELLRPGERAGRAAVAEATVGQTRAEILAREYEVVAEVREQWLAVLAAERLAALLDEELALRQRLADFARERRRLGEGTELESSVAELELAEVGRDRRRVEAESGTARRRLNRLMGLPTDYAVRLSDTGRPLEITIGAEQSDAELDQRILDSRPELAAGRAAYERAERELQLAVLGQYPRLRVGPAYERELGGDSALGLGVSVELPLLNQNQGEIAAKRAARDRARAAFVAALHRIRSDAFDARAAVRAARGEVEAQQRDILPLLRRNQELFEGAFRAKELTINDWVTAQQRAVRARREYLDAVIRLRGATIKLEAAIGRPVRKVPTTSPATRPAGTTRS